MSVADQRVVCASAGLADSRARDARRARGRRPRPRRARPAKRKRDAGALEHATGRRAGVGVRAAAIGMALSIGFSTSPGRGAVRAGGELRHERGRAPAPAAVVRRGRPRRRGAVQGQRGRAGPVPGGAGGHGRRHAVPAAPRPTARGMGPRSLPRRADDARQAKGRAPAARRQRQEPAPGTRKHPPRRRPGGGATGRLGREAAPACPGPVPGDGRRKLRGPDGLRTTGLSEARGARREARGARREARGARREANYNARRTAPCQAFTGAARWLGRESNGSVTQEPVPPLPGMHASRTEPNRRYYTVS